MIKQAIALTWVNILAFRHRLVGSMISILSIACVSAVMLSVLTMTDGMVKTMARSGLDNTLLVMRAGASSELQSVMFPTEVNILANHPAIARDSKGKSIVAAEMFVSADYRGVARESNAAIKEEQGVGQSLALRGISQNTFKFRPNFHLVRGTSFTTGRKQVIVGQAIARRLPEIQVGKTLVLGNSQWQVMGIFSDNNSVFESEIWADIGMVQSDYQRGNSIQSVRLALSESAELKVLKAEWAEDPRLNIRVMKEKRFFAEQAGKLTRLIRWIGMPVALIMALGALVAALNTMYGAIAGRSKEIATQKAIGFAAFAIFTAVISEALLLAFLGAALGIVPLYLVFDGWTAATQNAASLSQMMFNFDISLGLIVQTLALSVLIGLIGGLLPAIKATRLPVTLALRDN